MTECVWFSDLDGIETFRNYISADRDGPSSKEWIAAGYNWQGDVVPPRAIPKGIRARTAKTGPLSELTLIRNNFLVIGPRLTAFLSTVDLGAGGLHPLDVYDSAGGLMSSGVFHFWNFGNQATHLCPDQSQELDKSNFGYEKPGEHKYFPPIFPKDDTIALSRACLEGPNVWRERFLSKGTFMRDQMVRGLCAEGLDGLFGFVRCRVV